MASNFTSDPSVYPSGAGCFRAAFEARSSPTDCLVKNDMVSFLNLTSGDFRKSYLTAYCAVGAPSDDGCPYGFCPNNDIAGPPVRISMYLTNFFVAILIFHQRDQESINQNFWAQIMSLYTLIFACGISILLDTLTRFHAILTIAMAGSPLTFYIFVYALRSIWDGQHRLASVVGKGQILPRTLVLSALGIWIALFIYILMPSHANFYQRSCENAFEGINALILRYFYALPILLFIDASTEGKWLGSSPLLLTTLAWTIAIILQRKNIWPTGERYRPRFRKVWAVIKYNYPFIQFVSIVFLPFGYWVATIEVALHVTLGSNDDHFDPSFGQILAVFVTVPPMIAVAKLVPRLYKWFIDLTWVRILTCRQQDVAPSKTYSHTETESTCDLGNGEKQACLTVGSGDKDWIEEHDRV